MLPVGMHPPLHDKMAAGVTDCVLALHVCVTLSICTPLRRSTGVPAGERTVTEPTDAKSVSFRSNTGYNDGITEVFSRLKELINNNGAKQVKHSTWLC